MIYAVLAIQALYDLLYGSAKACTERWGCKKLQSKKNVLKIRKHVMSLVVSLFSVLYKSIIMLYVYNKYHDQIYYMFSI